MHPLVEEGPWVENEQGGSMEHILISPGGGFHSLSSWVRTLKPW